MNVTTIRFAGQLFDGGSFKVHGGKYQRGRGSWSTVGITGVDTNSQQGGDCYRRGDGSAEFQVILTSPHPHKPHLILIVLT